MTAKHDIKFIKKFMTDHGWFPLFETYTDNKQKLKCSCPKGHINYVRFNDIQQCFSKNSLKYSGCDQCGKIYRASILRNEFEFIKETFEKAGCILLNTEYTNNRHKLDYICPKGHKHQIKWVDFVSNSYNPRCPICNILESLSSKEYCPIWSDKEYKADIRARDNNICQNPYCFKTTNKLHIHHIDYDKFNCHPSNLITICGSCNSRANTDRDWHKEWYQTIMSKKFNL